MAHRLKHVRYQNTPRKILLQNENGPCPLLAAANALLLRGVINLPPACVRNGVASIDDVVNMLAERAIKRFSDQAEADASGGEWLPAPSKNKKILGNSGAPMPGADSVESKATDPDISTMSLHHEVHHDRSREHHLDELLSLFPSLQYGMDVNPKFTMGPTGVEFTKNLTAFDLLGVELVHGWLLDPQDKQAVGLIGKKSYNELIELVVRGNEAASEVEGLAKEIQMVERKLLLGRQQPASTPHFTGEEIDKEDSEWVNVDTASVDAQNQTSAQAAESSVLCDERVETCAKDSVQDTTCGDEGPMVSNDTQADATPISECPISSEKIKPLDATEENVAESNRDLAPTSTVDANDTSQLSNPLSDSRQESASEGNAVPITEEEMQRMSTDLERLQSKHHEKSTTATNGAVINAFLTSSCHQLTYHGLHELHNHLAEECLCVFFRNNHFATVTKHEGVLYLLVTDLGYANVPEVMWEKLDAIDGDTEYADEFFMKPKPRAELRPSSGPNLSPEQMLAQSSRAEADYQLALQLSKNGGRGATEGELDDVEGRLVAAATEASIKEWNGADAVGAENTSSDFAPQGPSAPPIETGESSVRTKSTLKSGGQSENNLAEDSDRAMALALQAQFESDHDSEQLARQLQDQENRLAQSNRQRTAGRGNFAGALSGAGRLGTAVGSTGGNEKSSCVIQ